MERIILDENADFRTQTFALRIGRNDLDHIYCSLREGTLNITCPRRTDFADRKIQSLLWATVERTIRVEAKRVLPQRLNELAAQHGFVYSSVRIKNMRSRWGSCTSKKAINLSMSLMLLPPHLTDYVLLHELCHTVVMNHSATFRALLDKVTGNRSKAYRQEMKRFSPLAAR